MKKMLVYVADPMCSWCYGFTKEIAKIRRKYDDMQFGMIMGGLKPYNQEVMDDVLANWLRGHWEEIEEKTEQPFKYDILDLKNFVYDTEPPARAVVVARSISAAKEFDYFRRVQSSFYAYNRHPHDTNTYVNIARDLGISTTEFRKRFTSHDYILKTTKDFELARKLGINGFPSVLMILGDNSYIVARGYVKASEMVERIEGVLAELEE
jgi:putative protein-disulfide isomerase